MDETIALMLPVIIAVVEFLKKIIGDWLSGTKTVVASFIVGVLIGLVKFQSGVILSLPQAILLGLYAGGIAAGLWSAGRKIMKV